MSARSKTEALRRAALLCALLLGSGAGPAPAGPPPPAPEPQATPAAAQGAGEPAAQPGPAKTPPRAQPAREPAASRTGEPAASGSKAVAPERSEPKSNAAKPSLPKPGAAKPAAAEPQPQSSGAAAPADSAALLGQVQARYEAVVDLRANFEQRSRVASLGREDTSSGKLAVRRPGRMRWEYSAPEAHVLTLDGKTLRMYVPSERQLQIAALDPSSFSPTALSFLLGDGNLVEDFNAEGLPAGAEGELGLRLRPKQDSGFEYLELWLAPGSLTLRESVVVDLFGNRTAVRFSDLVENAGVPEDIFEIQVPAETEVIDLR